ncbi:MAG: hypothetical protein JNJ57_18850, partial [Saprospiraceae bacterium]|nr:hypothetical protein [Saprospiraceae bacterium]
MRTNLLLTAILSIFIASAGFAQKEPMPDSTGLPGDHFSLEGALELFKKATSPEDFEKLLNDSNSKVNNLDLNEDGEVDYIRVVDNTQGDVHALVLQVPVNENESQDVAVIEVEKTGAEEAMLQIIGNEEVYGEQVIVEPFEEEKTKGNGGKNGPAFDGQKIRIVVNVWVWPSVRFVYGPAYRPWVSPWRWRVYPVYWRPWRPHPWAAFRAWSSPFRPRYHVVTTHRVVRAHAVYTPHRRTSKTVHTRTTTVVAHKGKHGTTVKQKTTTSGPRGTKTTTKAVHKGKNGNVTAG